MTADTILSAIEQAADRTDLSLWIGGETVTAICIQRDKLRDVLRAALAEDGGGDNLADLARSDADAAFEAHRKELPTAPQSDEARRPAAVRFALQRSEDWWRKAAQGGIQRERELILENIRLTEEIARLRSRP